MKTTSEPLPFEPETFEAMCARWPAVLAVVYQRDLVDSGQQMAPGFSRTHVFDFADGIRLIATVDDVNGTNMLHLSFGIHSSFHAVWIPRGKGAYVVHVSNLVHQLSSAGMITGALDDSMLTERAYHFWFQ